MSLMSILVSIFISLMFGAELKKWLRTKNPDSLALLCFYILMLSIVFLNEILNRVSLVVIGG